MTTSLPTAAAEGVWSAAAALFLGPGDPPPERAALGFRVQDDWDGAPSTLPHADVMVALGPEVVWVGVDAPWGEAHAPAEPPGSLDGLWEYDVVELFLLGEGERYLELELGPCGHYLALELEGRRQCRRRGAPIAFQAARSGDRWAGLAAVPRDWLPPGPLRANAYTIHTVSGRRHYRAWTPVPGPSPDFHRLEAFPTVALF